MQVIHQKMETEHTQWESEHTRMCQQIATMRSDHFKAFSLLRRIEADLLRHEAEFTEVLEEIRVHTDEIHEHNRQIQLHGEFVDTELHKNMEKRHKEYTDKHASKLEKLQKLSACHQKVMAELKNIESLVGEMHC